jgi:hypothetical protein
MTMHHIASSIITGASATYACSFNNVPQTFEHLQVRVYARGTQASVSNFMLMQYNADSSNTYYAEHHLIGNGSSVTSNQATSQTYVNIGSVTGNTALANNFGVAIIDILDYTSTTKHKVSRTIIGYDNNGSGEVQISSGLYANTVSILPITLLQLYMANAQIGTRIDLYGINTNPIATGA